MKFAIRAILPLLLSFYLLVIVVKRAVQFSQQGLGIRQFRHAEIILIRTSRPTRMVNALAMANMAAIASTIQKNQPNKPGISTGFRVDAVFQDKHIA